MINSIGRIPKGKSLQSVILGKLSTSEEQSQRAWLQLLYKRATLFKDWTYTYTYMYIYIYMCRCVYTYNCRCIRFGKMYIYISATVPPARRARGANRRLPAESPTSGWKPFRHSRLASGPPPSGWKSFRNSGCICQRIRQIQERTHWKSVLSAEQVSRESWKCILSYTKPSVLLLNVTEHMPGEFGPKYKVAPHGTPSQHPKSNKNRL